MEENEKETKPVGLSGTEINSLIDERLKTERQKWEMEQLKKEKVQLEGQVKEAEEYIEKLETALKEKPQKGGLGSLNVGELASAALEGLIRRNPGILKKFPGGEALAGALQGEEKESDPQETEASFKKKSSEALSEEDKQALEVLNMLKNSFGQEQLKQVWEILRSLAGKPEMIPTVLDLVKT